MIIELKQRLFSKEYHLLFLEQRAPKLGNNCKF